MNQRLSDVVRRSTLGNPAQYNGSFIARYSTTACNYCHERIVAGEPISAKAWNSRSGKSRSVFYYVHERCVRDAKERDLLSALRSDYQSLKELNAEDPELWGDDEEWTQLQKLAKRFPEIATLSESPYVAPIRIQELNFGTSPGK